MPQYDNPVYDFRFRYSHYDNRWHASKNTVALENDLASPEVISSSKIEVLLGLIRQYDGDVEKIQSIK